MKLSVFMVTALLFVGIIVAFAGCTSTPVPTPTPTPTTMAMAMTTVPQATGTVAPASAPGAGPGVTLPIAAKNVLFNVTSITVPAGATVTVYFDNQDAGIPHNFAVYTNQQATTKIFVGQIINGPGTTTYTFTAPSTPGSYWFRCDVHPTVMYGTLNVVANGPVTTVPNPAFS
ncbi:MAG TPA: cupredoxin domain-containing protein [Methanoregulaceae archaeon]|nr:cupredoxin domain-containing protein [Methanoregulaceae archaeon]